MSLSSDTSVTSRPGLGALAAAFAIRSGIAYLVIYVISSLSNLVALVPFLGAGWQAVVLGVGRHVFHFDQMEIGRSGSGDTLYNYVELACFAMAALLVALVWTALRRREATVAPFPDWLRIAVRYSLALSMLTYGIMKVFHLQFSTPSLDRLMQPYGESSPMGLLWTFMGYSPAYSFFGGAAEVLGGVLLLFRRTTTLGALVVAGVMTNVVMLNFCYDVPVKIYSSHLLLLALWLALPDFRRLADLLVLNRPTQPADVSPPTLGRWLRWGRVGVKTVIIGGLLVGSPLVQFRLMQSLEAETKRPPLFGAYQVEAFSTDGEEPADGSAWRSVVVNAHGGVTARRLDGLKLEFASKTDTRNRKLALTGIENRAVRYSLAYAQPDPTKLTLSGEIEGHAVAARLRKLDRSRFLLMNRGFHWVNEKPFNR